MVKLEKICSVCGACNHVDIETVTNVAGRRDEMFPVMLCSLHKISLVKGDLDVRFNDKGDLYFVLKNKKTPS